MEILIRRTILGSKRFSLPLLHLMMTFTFLLTAMLPTNYIVKSEPTLQQETGPLQDLPGFQQLHPNGFPVDDTLSGEDDYNSYPSVVVVPPLAQLPETRADDATKRVDPHGSWLSFVRHSSKPGDKKCEKNKKSSRTLLETAGPPGPPGPKGPPGPPGAEVTREELFEEFRELITEAAERKAQILVQEKCPSCLANSTQAWLPDISDLQILPQLPIAFHCKLLKGVEVHKKSLVEISNFQTPFADGSFKRGDGLDVKSGRFTAPRTAIYQFSASLHINHPVSKKRIKELKYRDHLRLLICIDSLCYRHTSLEFISGMESNSRVFTITVTGLLRLQAGRYASVYIDNSSSRTVTIQSGSDFTGLLMGV